MANPLEHIPTPELKQQQSMAEFEATAAQNYLQLLTNELVRRNVYEKNEYEQAPLF